MRTKYVVLKERDGTTDKDGRFIDSENIYVFPNNVVHKDFVSSMSTRRRCLGAGFVVNNHDGTHWCNGESESLGIKSRPEDTVLLKILLGEQL